MNDLVSYSNLFKNCPTVRKGLERAAWVFSGINSFEDIERVFLQGQGLSPCTYRNYLTAVEQFYAFTGGMHPMQVTAADVEMFYDDLLKKVDRNTARLKVAGLKKFFAGVEKVCPLIESPFKSMSEKLNRKLNRTKKSTGTKKALTKGELRALLDYLGQYHTVKDRGTYAMVFMLVTSGLRAAELLQLRWRDLEQIEGAWSATFTQKGGDAAQQELYEPAIKAAHDCFVAQFRRNPQADDKLFWTVASFNGDIPRGMTYAALLLRIREVGQEVTDRGIIKRALTWSPHLFRRTYATLLYKSGMGIKAIQGKTRHASLEVLSKHYLDDTESGTPYLNKALA